MLKLLPAVALLAVPLYFLPTIFATTAPNEASLADDACACGSCDIGCTCCSDDSVSCGDCQCQSCGCQGCVTSCCDDKAGCCENALESVVSSLDAGCACGECDAGCQCCSDANVDCDDCSCNVCQCDACVEAEAAA